MSEEMRDVFGNKIVFAERDMVIRNQELLRKLLIEVGRVMMDSMDPEEWADNCWISDESNISDFGLEDDELKRISEALHVPIASSEPIYAILARMGGAQ
jgi:hypothetical protein